MSRTARYRLIIFAAWAFNASLSAVILTSGERHPLYVAHAVLVVVSAPSIARRIAFPAEARFARVPGVYAARK